MGNEYHTVAEFVDAILAEEITTGGYTSHKGRLSRWLRRNEANSVFLSPNLFERWVREQGISRSCEEGHSLYGGRIRFVNGQPEGTNCDVTLDIHGHYRVGFGSTSNGLLPEDT